MLVHIDKPIDRDMLEAICAFAKKYEAEIALYTQDESFESVLHQWDIMPCNIIAKFNPEE